MGLTFTANSGSPEWGDFTNVREPSDGDMFPDGSGAYSFPAGVAVSDDAGNDGQMSLGTVVKGRATRSNQPVNGTVYVYLQGEIAAAKSLSGTQYSVATVPAAVTAGASANPDSTSRVVIATESGGSAAQEITGGTTEFDVNFAGLNIRITDADGTPVAGDDVFIDGVKYTTDSNGVIETESSGVVTVSALKGGMEQDISLDPTSLTEVDYQYAGVRGLVKSQDGEPIAGKTVEILNANGVPIAEDTTDENGEYRLTKIPVTETLYALASPYFRSADTGDEGTYTVKNFPAPLLYTGSIDDKQEVSEDDLTSVQIKCVDPHEEKGAAYVPVRLGDWTTTTSKSGIAGVTVQKDEYNGEANVTVGGGKRYRQIERTVSLDTDGIIEVRLERLLRTSQK